MDNSVPYSVICLSHLRWDFVYQRPQHLLSRFARQTNVYFFEEPIYGDDATRLDVSRREDNLFVLVPRISHADRESRNVAEIQRELLDGFIQSENIKDFVLWFYTPMALDFADHLEPQATVFDCMDELSAFKFAPPELIENERRLLEKADVVFTGGQSLYEAKKDRHANAHAFPSSIDTKHFNQARQIAEEPADEKSIPHPRFGFCGVIDERMDIELLGQMAELRPDWHFVMIGPVVKIADEDLPRRPNIHYLGGKDYKDLPAYLAGWDVALMPFAMNESTKYISPTKTPEYLAAGLPVVSTPIRDVVRPYGERNLVQIASTAEEFVAACERALGENMSDRLQKADEFLSHNSWDKTFAEMSRLIARAIEEKPKAATQAV
ncbi:MAG TPA: glycosyltransferase family 1 protein [Pyrinomonadaceae bacterium]|jgi:glycosyltransferase involved in cell wall biosynthesis